MSLARFKALVKHHFDGIRAEYVFVFKDISDYFTHFGSWTAVVWSPFTHVSILVAALCWPTWMAPDWSDIPLEVLPSLLGFALAAYALLLAFGDDKFRAFLAVRKSTHKIVDPVKDSLLLNISSVFVHFVIIQIIALILAIVAHSHLLISLNKSGVISHDVFLSKPLRFVRDLFAFCSYFVFILSIATSANSAFNIYHSTRWYVEYKANIEATPEDGAGAPVK